MSVNDKVQNQIEKDRILSAVPQAKYFIVSMHHRTKQLDF
jgi:hypothetical protein